jgi:HK97 family phage portal protein
MLLESLFGGRVAASTRDAASPHWWGGLDPMSAAGMPVTDETSMRVSTVFAALRVLSWSLASVPLITYRRTADDRGSERAKDLGLYSVLRRRPNRWQTSFQWRSMGMVHALLRGNFFNRIVSGPRGFADQLRPLMPDHTRPVDQLPDGRLVYLHTPSNRPEERLTSDEVLHIPGLSLDGISGVSVITAMREGVGLALAQERYGASQFGRAPKMAGLLKHPAVMKPQTAQRVAESFRRANAGPANWHSVAVLEEGMEWVSTGMNAKDAEFILSRDFQISEFLRFLGVPGVMVGYADKTATYASAEQFFLSFVTYSVGGWAVNWEQKFDTELILEEDQETVFTKFVLDGLKRGDLKTRFEAYERGITNQFMTPNEARAFEDWNPLEGGDEVVEAPAPSAPPSNGANERARAIARSAAERVVRKEVEAIRARTSTVQDTPEQLHAWLTKFYEGHVRMVQQVLCLTGAQAWGYVYAQREAVLADPACMSTWEEQLVPRLAARALGEEERDAAAA